MDNAVVFVLPRMLKKVCSPFPLERILVLLPYPKALKPILSLLGTGTQKSKTCVPAEKYSESVKLVIPPYSGLSKRKHSEHTIHRSNEISKILVRARFHLGFLSRRRLEAFHIGRSTQKSRTSELHAKMATAVLATSYMPQIKRAKRFL